MAGRGRTRLEAKSLKLSICHEPNRSKILSERGCMDSTFSQKCSKLTFVLLSLISLSYWGKTKKDRLRVNCKALLTWVGDGVGGLLGSDKAYRKLTLKHHPDKMKRSMKVVLKVFIFWKLAFQLPGSLNVQRACSRLFFLGKQAP